MKDIKRLCRIAAGIVLVIAVACGIDAWNEAQPVIRETDRMPELWHILTFAEDKGAEWATDELLINNVDSFKKASLYKKWGEPTDHAASAKEDIWVLSDQFRLIVDYDDTERIERIKVVSSK